MTEEEEISGEKENDLNDYSQIDPLIAIVYQAEPDSIYYINPPQELSTYPMYIENPEKKRKKYWFIYLLYIKWNRYYRKNVKKI